jgi:hypothetical protein
MACAQATSEAAEKKRVDAELEEAQTWLKEMQAKVEAVLQLAQQSSEEKTQGLMVQQQETERKLEAERAQVTELRKKESENQVAKSVLEDELATVR